MNLEKMIHERKEAYDRKDYAESDLLRSILEAHNIFTFDYPDGFQEVHYYPFKTTRKEVELKMKRDREAESRFNAWLTSHTVK